jgi:hypothetical protein
MLLLLLRVLLLFFFFFFFFFSVVAHKLPISRYNTEATYPSPPNLTRPSLDRPHAYSVEHSTAASASAWMTGNCFLFFFSLYI